jgi:glycosyltransferase involved in cell wall biosynthesis
MRSRNNPRVLVISDHFFPESFLGNEIPGYIHENGFDVEVLTQNASYPEGIVYRGESNPLFRITRMGSIRVYRVKTITGYRDSVFRKVVNYLWFMLAASLFVLVCANRYDFFFVYHVGTLTEAVPLYIAKRVFGKRTSIWTQDIWPDSVFSFGFKKNSISIQLLTSFVSAIYSSIDSIMVSSPGFVGKIKASTARQKTPFFIPQWAPRVVFEMVEPCIKFDHKNFNFIFTGNIGTQQNLHSVVNAFGIVEKIGKNCVLHIVGDGRNLSGLKSLVHDNDIGNVEFYRRIPQNQVLSLLKKADACVISLAPDPAIELTLPAKFQTYLFSGRPILCVARGESRALIERYGLGAVAEPDSVESIVEAIITICDFSPNKRNEISEKMRSTSTRLFNEEESKKAILAGIIGKLPMGMVVK